MAQPGLAHYEPFAALFVLKGSMLQWFLLLIVLLLSLILNRPWCHFMCPMRTGERVLQDILDGHDKVQTVPEPIVRLHELGDSSVNFAVRPWVDSNNYWDVYWDITRAVKMRFDEEGITIPFPQRDVHIHK